MARIRTIKPEFFRHEQLQDIEAENPKSYVMLVFAALWGHCDKQGRFLWKPRHLKLDILPFLDFDMAATLELLCQHGFVRRYEVDGKQYGKVLSFETHQRLTGKEAQEGGRFPDEIILQQPGSNGEAPVKHPGAQEGKGKEGNGDIVASLSLDVSKIDQKQEPDASFNWAKAPSGVDHTHWRDWLKVRKTKKATNTDSAWGLFSREAGKAGVTIADAVRVCAERGWAGFEAEWIGKEERGNTSGLNELVDTVKRISTNTEDAVCPRKRVAT